MGQGVAIAYIKLSALGLDLKYYCAGKRWEPVLHKVSQNKMRPILSQLCLWSFIVFCVNTLDIPRLSLRQGKLNILHLPQHIFHWDTQG